MMDGSVNIFDNTGTVSGDSSLNLLSKDEFVELIVPKVQEILNKRFPDNPAKRRIKVYKDRISFAAPCCGDSASIQHRIRGNVILEGKFKNLYKCFNCGTCMSLPNFFKSYGKDLSLREINYIVSNKASFQAFSGTFDIFSIRQNVALSIIPLALAILRLKAVKSSVPPIPTYSS